MKSNTKKRQAEQEITKWVNQERLISISKGFQGMAQQDMLHDLLNRKLRQFSNLNGGIELNSFSLNDTWNDDNSAKYFIEKSEKENEFEIDYVYTYKRQGVVHFISRDIAERAIEEIIKPFMKEHKEFVW